MISLNTVYIKLFYLLIVISTFGYFYFILEEELGNILSYSFLYVTFNILAYIVIYKINSIFIKIQFLFFYVGYLLAMIIIFINKDKYTQYGWTAIGNYNFEPDKTFEVLSLIFLYIFIFVIISFILDKLLIKKYYINKIVINQNFIKILKPIRKYRHIFISILILQLYLSFFMFQYKIGIVGITPETLPFRLSGALYYYRYIIIPIIAGILLFSNLSYKNSFLVLLIMIETFIAGILSVSKAIPILHMLPVIVYLYIVKKYILVYFMYGFTIFVVMLASLSRNIIYNVDNFKQLSFFNILNDIFSYEKFSIEYFFKIIGLIITRVGGFNEFLVTYFNDIKFVSNELFFSSVLGLKFLYNGNFNTTLDLYGIIVPEDKSFGVPVDALSYLYLSSDNIFIASLFIFIWVFCFILSEKIINTIFSKYTRNIWYIIIINFYLLLAFVNPNVKNLFFYIPILLLLLHLVYTYIKVNFKKKEKIV